MVRDNSTNGEEELYCSGKVAIHSKGSQSTRVLQKSYTCEHEIKHALWCSFRTYTLEQLSKSKDVNDEDAFTGKTIDCICLLDTYTLKVFTETGEDYVSSLQFQVIGLFIYSISGEIKLFITSGRELLSASVIDIFIYSRSLLYGQQNSVFCSKSLKSRCLHLGRKLFYQLFFQEF